MRKGSCTANARLQSFEKGMFFCKLTVGFLQLNRQSSVSLGLCELLPQHVYKTPFIFSLPCMSQNSHPFSQTKHFPFVKKLSYCHQKLPIFVTNAVNFRSAITYCPPKNNAVLFHFALNPYAVKPEPSTDSKPFRRRFVRKAGFGLCCQKTLL